MQLTPSAKPSALPTPTEIECPACGDKLPVVILVVEERTVPNSVMLLLRVELTEPHTCPPGPGLPLEEAA